MRKFAANYVLSGNGDFLKNGIVITGDGDTAIEYVDTRGDLDEIAQLSFHNGILLAGFTFLKTNNEIPVSENDQPNRDYIFRLIRELNQLSVQQWIEAAKQVQEQFPSMKIPEIVEQLNEVLISNGGFAKEDAPGIYLINANLVEMHFTGKSKLKKIG